MTQTVHDTLRALEARRVFEAIDARAQAVTSEQIILCEIPAPPFGEVRRAKYLHERFTQLGLDRVSIDEEGNVVGILRGGQARPVVVVSAHMDTVFPEGSDVRVRILDGLLHAPGISDNCSGLATLLAIAQAILEHHFPLVGTLILLGTVGEEAHGNLRGVRYFFNRGEWSGNPRIDAFITLDGHGLERIVDRGLGSRRFRVQMSGPGGHSWGDFGLVNPIHALASLVIQLARFPFSDEPRSSMNVGTIRGGRSVNAIPQTASIDVDLRSTAAAEIDRLEAYLRQSAEEAVEMEQQRAGAKNGRIHHEIKILGERPAGQIAHDSELLKVVVEATRVLGIEPTLESASTDANIPISMGIPAVAIGAGGMAGGVHTLQEWYDPCTRETGIKRALLAALTLVGLGL